MTVINYIMLPTVADCIIVRQWTQQRSRIKEKEKEKTRSLVASIVTAVSHPGRRIISSEQISVVVGSTKTNQIRHP